MESPIFDPKFTDLFRDTSRDEWEFGNDASGGDLRLMRFNNNPYQKLEDQTGYDSLPSFVQQMLKRATVYSTSEVAGFDRYEFTNDRLISMFGSDVIYTKHDDKNAAFYKALEEWFDTIPSQAAENDPSQVGADSFELDDTKSYGLTSSLMSIFGGDE